MNTVNQSPKASRKSQLLWFIGLWIVGFVSVASIAYAFRWLVQFAYQ